MIQNSSGIDDPNLVFSGFQQGDIVNFPTNCSTFTGLFFGTGTTTNITSTIVCYKVIACLK